MILPKDSTDTQFNEIEIEAGRGMKLNIDRERMGRLVLAGKAAGEICNDLAADVSDARDNLRHAQNDHRRQCEYDKRSQAALAAQSEAEIAEGLLRDALEKQRKYTADHTPSQHLAARVREFAAARGIRL